MRHAAVGVCLLCFGLLANRPAAAAPEPPTPTVLVRQLAQAKLPADVAAAHAAVRARGTAVLAALHASAQTHAARPQVLARLDRARRLITEDFHRRNVPDGMVYVPAGLVEAPHAEHACAAGERVHIEAFYIDKLETTVAAWRAWLVVLDAAERPWRGQRPSPDVDGRLPISAVSQHDAGTYARRARKGRLPTMLEFHRALRGSGVGTYPWGESVRPAQANLDFGSGARPRPVGSYPSATSPFGVLDLVGNLAEWSSTTTPSGSVGVRPRVWRSSYLDRPSKALTWQGRPGKRTIDSPAAFRPWIGIRVVIDPPAPKPQ